uniref:Uncharacterized protein n=1 Tax=Anguilla anguilla TaxID=7936 RepID=A0A0E9VPG7_ANGAN
MVTSIFSVRVMSARCLACSRENTAPRSLRSSAFGILASAALDTRRR